MKKRFCLLKITCLLVAFTVGPAFANNPPVAVSNGPYSEDEGSATNEMATNISDEAYHNQQGLSHFKRGVYELSPQQRKKEAAQEYRLAIQAFKKALSINPDNAEALRNLARVYAVQKDFLLAAELYVKLTDLDPYALDAYMYAASAFERAQRYDDARAQLENARGKTTDPEIIEKLNGYLKEIERRAQQGE